APRGERRPAHALETLRRRETLHGHQTLDGRPVQTLRRRESDRRRETRDRHRETRVRHRETLRRRRRETRRRWRQTSRGENPGGGPVGRLGHLGARELESGETLAGGRRQTPPRRERVGFPESRRRQIEPL